MPRHIAEQIVVITGASSGIGRETALRIARRGGAVVLAARNERALHDLADQIRASRGRAHVVPTDVSDPQQVDRLADEAVKTFGRIDTWVNDAAVSEYATFEQMTDEEFRRIVDVNLMGPVYGTRAALRCMRRQPEGGTIINIGSVLSDRAVPLQSAYVATKHALRGFTDAVRMELVREDIGVNITLILPSAINTPFFDHARSRMQREPAPAGAVYEPAVVADVIIHAAQRPVREIYVGGYGKLVSILNKISPRLVDWYMTRGGRMFRTQQDELLNDGRDTLVTTSGELASARGRWGQRSHRRSAYTRYLEPHPVAKGLLFGAFVVGAAVGLMAVGRASKSARRAPSRQNGHKRGQGLVHAIRERLAHARDRAARRSRAVAADPRDPLIRNAYVPMVRALLDAGIDPRTLPGFDRLQARFITRLEEVRRQAEADRSRH